VTALNRAGVARAHRGVPRPASRSPTARRSSRSTRATRRSSKPPACRSRSARASS
jgi:hypothetical protein